MAYIATVDLATALMSRNARITLAIPMAHRILIAEPDAFSPEAVALLRGVAEVEQRSIATSDLGDAFDHYDVVWIRLGHRIDASLLSRSSRCRIIATAVTGLDHIDLDACAEQGVDVLSLRGETEFLREGRATAELTVALVLALIRRLPAAIASVERGRWERDHFRGNEVYRKTAGIVGVGRLGKIVGEYLNSLGMNVLGFDNTPFEAPNITVVDSLAQLLERSDVVTLHVSLNASTEKLIGAPELALMRPGAVLVNTARGRVIDDEALLEALSQNAIAGAALDVLAGEPNIEADHPLIRYAQQHDNLIITPHIGGNTYESFQKTEVFLAKKVVRALAVRPPRAP